MLHHLAQWVNTARAVILALVVHAAVLGILFVNLQFMDVKPRAIVSGVPITTSAVDTRQVKKEIQKVPCVFQEATLEFLPNNQSCRCQVEGSQSFLDLPPRFGRVSQPRDLDGRIEKRCRCFGHFTQPLAKTNRAKDQIRPAEASDELVSLPIHRLLQQARTRRGALQESNIVPVIDSQNQPSPLRVLAC